MKYKDLGLLVLYRYLPDEKAILDWQPDWLVYKKQLSLHIYFPNLALAFQFVYKEYDSLEEHREREKFRWQICRKNGVKLYTITCDPIKFPYHLGKILGYKVDMPNGLHAMLKDFSPIVISKRIGKISRSQKMIRRYNYAQEQEYKHNLATKLFDTSKERAGKKATRGEPFVVKKSTS